MFESVAVSLNNVNSLNEKLIQKTPKVLHLNDFHDCQEEEDSILSLSVSDLGQKKMRPTVQGTRIDSNIRSLPNIVNSLNEKLIQKTPKVLHLNDFHDCQEEEDSILSLSVSDLGQKKMRPTVQGTRIDSNIRSLPNIVNGFNEKLTQKTPKVLLFKAYQDIATILNIKHEFIITTGKVRDRDIMAAGLTCRPYNTCYWIGKTRAVFNAKPIDSEAFRFTAELRKGLESGFSNAYKANLWAVKHLGQICYDTLNALFWAVKEGRININQAVYVCQANNYYTSFLAALGRFGGHSNKLWGWIRKHLVSLIHSSHANIMAAGAKRGRKKVSNMTYTRTLANGEKVTYSNVRQALDGLMAAPRRLALWIKRDWKALKYGHCSKLQANCAKLRENVQNLCKTLAIKMAPITYMEYIPIKKESSCLPICEKKPEPEPPPDAFFIQEGPNGQVSAIEEVPKTVDERLRKIAMGHKLGSLAQKMGVFARSRPAGAGRKTSELLAFFEDEY